MTAGLLVLISLEEAGLPRFRWLYRFLEGAGAALAYGLLAPRYRETRVLDRLNGLGLVEAAVDSLRDCEALDVVLFAHGLPDALFAGAERVAPEALGAVLGAHSKPRLLYSTACYGAEHASAFQSSGFRTVIGARAVNANGASEVPAFFTLWGAGQTAARALATAQTPATRLPADAAARLAGFEDVNSEKRLLGDGRLRITSAI